MDDQERAAMQASCAAWVLHSERDQDSTALLVGDLRRVWEAAWTARQRYQPAPGTRKGRTMLDPEQLDLALLATCVLEELEELGIVDGIADDEQGTTDAWRRAQAAVLLALQNGLRHLAEEAGETEPTRPTPANEAIAILRELWDDASETRTIGSYRIPVEPEQAARINRVLAAAHRHTQEGEGEARDGHE